MTASRLVLTALAGATLSLPACAQRSDSAGRPSGAPVEQGAKNVPSFEPAFPEQTRAPAMESGVELAVRTVADGLVHPWGIAVLPEGGYLVTERPGRLRHVSAGGEVGEPVQGVPEVFAQGQGGLLDVALADDFSRSGMIFLTYAKPMGGGKSATAAARATLGDDMRALSDVRDIFVQEPPSSTAKHYGSRVVQDGDLLYVTMGEHFTQKTRDYAQDLDKTYGKVVRITLDGEAPESNPFTDRQGAIDTIWSYGHRNVQGADIRPETGGLFTIEHGPKGGDELNFIEPGTNYGWPVVSYGRQYSGPLIGSGEPRKEGMREPRYYWDPVIAPGGFAFYEGDMFPDWQGDILASSLSPGALVRLKLQGEGATTKVIGEERFLRDRGRIRDVAIDNDGAILVLTDKTDGAILRLTPARTN